MNELSTEYVKLEQTYKPVTLHILFNLLLNNCNNIRIHVICCVLWFNSVIYGLTSTLSLMRWETKSRLRWQMCHDKMNKSFTQNRIPTMKPFISICICPVYLLHRPHDMNWLEQKIWNTWLLIRWILKISCSVWNLKVLCLKQYGLISVHWDKVLK